MNHLLEIKDLRVEFSTDAGTVRAVDGVSYNVDRGETLAIVGESGCGKSVSALSIMRLVATPPGRNIRKACSVVSLRPRASNEKPVPHPVSSRTASTGSTSAALTTSVAPTTRASSSFASTTSMAIIRPAPVIAAPFTREDRVETAANPGGPGWG